MMFTDKEVLEYLLSSNWVRITLSKLAEPAQRECSRSRMCHMHARGLYLAAHGKGWPKALTVAQLASQPLALAQKVEPKQEDTVH